MIEMCARVKALIRRGSNNRSEFPILRSPLYRLSRTFIGRRVSEETTIERDYGQARPRVDANVGSDRSTDRLERVWRQKVDARGLPGDSLREISTGISREVF